MILIGIMFYVKDNSFISFTLEDLYMSKSSTHNIKAENACLDEQRAKELKKAEMDKRQLISLEIIMESILESRRESLRHENLF